MAWATEQDSVSKIEAKFGEICPASDMVDMERRFAMLSHFSASLACASISCPDKGAMPLPIQAGIECLMLACDSALPARVAISHARVSSTTRRAKLSIPVGRGNRFLSSTPSTDDIDFSGLSIRAAPRSKSICTDTTAREARPRRSVLDRSSAALANSVDPLAPTGEALLSDLRFRSAA